MKSVTDYLWFNTRQHREFINITDKVEELVRRSGIAEGFVLVSAMHITAGVYVNDAESGLIADIEEWLERFIEIIMKEKKTNKRESHKTVARKDFSV